ncbi:alpha/beta fold hydrolase [Halosimplex aquaticum]|uniref:Alpha/beta fold hydrolase n=1 Tax=Halosimplex aquaticum TaxID=3026162 RepID=A0ABD5Y344_9EURY|nr:alpha/beta hydrolase [Halosimplex aquaticum]
MGRARAVSGERTDGSGAQRERPIHPERVESVEYGPEERRLSYAEYGDPSGEPVVVLHGTPGSRLLGALFDEDARDRCVRVLAPDRPGFGRSADWSGRRPIDAGAWFEALLADADVSTAPVAAFSGGSADGLALAATRGDLVDRLDLVSGAVPPSIARGTPRLQRTLGRVAVRTPRLLGAALRGQTSIAARGSPSTVVGQYTDEPGEIRASTAELVRRDFVESCTRSRNGAVTELSWVVEGWGFDVRDVDCPVTLWHGDRDANVPVADASRLRDRLSNGQLTRLDADHLTALSASRSRILDRVAPRD